MTVRLLAAWGIYPANAIISIDSATESGLVAAKFADTNLTGGTVYQASANNSPDNNQSEILRPAGLLRTVIMGDSMTAGASSNGSITSLTRANNIVTLTLTTHGRGTGELCTIYNTLDPSYSVNNVAVTRVDANTLTYPAPGPDGTTTHLVGTKTMQLQSAAWCSDASYLPWLQSKCGGAIKLIHNAGRNGQDSVDMLARYDADVVRQADHDMVIIFTGFNDFVSGTLHLTADQVYANVTAMIAKSPGKRVVVVSSIPWGTASTDAYRKEAIRYNRKMRNFCGTMPNVRFADAAKYIINPLATAPTFFPATGMIDSGLVHPTPKGYERIAQAIYEVIQYDFPRVSRLTSCIGDTWGSDNSNPNILEAAPWTNTGGALAGGTTGVAAAGIGVTLAGGAAVASCPARANGIGYDQQVVFTPSANNDSITISGAGNIFSRTADGNKLNYIGELILSGVAGANIKAIDIYLTYASASAYHYLLKSGSWTAAEYPNADMTYTFASLIDSVICAGHTAVGWLITIKAGAAGTALTVKLGQQSIEKV